MRSWWRLSLRTWLIVITILTIVVGWLSRRQALTPTTASDLTEVATLDKDVWQIAWSPERSRMAVLGFGSSAEIRDSLSLQMIETIGEGKKLIHFAFSPEPGVVAFCKNGKTAEILDRNTGRLIVLDAKNDQPQMVFSPDGKMLATGGYGSSARLWRVSDGTLLQTLDIGPTVGGLTPVFGPDGKIVAVGNRNSTTYLFDTATGALLRTLDKPSSHEPEFSPDGRTLAIAYVDGTVALWNVEDGTLKCERKTSAEELYDVDWSPDGRMLATAGLKGKIALWDPADLSVIREIDAPEWVIGLRFSPDGRNLITAGGSRVPGGKRSLKIWGVEGSLFTLVNRPKQAAPKRVVSLPKR
jgi:WD40 repeat protein